jgi:hypothetical protein
MKTTINGLQVEGTPTEIMEFRRLMQRETQPALKPLMPETLPWMPRPWQPYIGTPFIYRVDETTKPWERPTVRFDAILTYLHADYGEQSMSEQSQA